MLNQARCQSRGWMSSHKAEMSEILPCTVSQLLAASQVSSDTFAISKWKLSQVSVVGIIRGFAPFVTIIQYSVDDMTGPPLNVKQWVNKEACAQMTSASIGTYVKVTGNLRNFTGQRSLLAMDIHCVKDLNEITSHMLEVVQAHMRLFGKAFDVNMNTTATSLSGRLLGYHSDGRSRNLPNGLSTIQDQVLRVVKQFSLSNDGISYLELKAQLDCHSMEDIRTALTFLTNEGHVFTIDEHHFKSTEY